MEKSAWKFLFKALLWLFQIPLGIMLVLVSCALLSGEYSIANIEPGTRLIDGLGGTVYFFMYFITIRKLILIIRSTEESPFILDNVKRFRIMGICMCVNSVLECIIGYSSGRNNSIVEIIATPNGAITPMMLVCIITSLMCFVIGDVFDKAIKIKDENDLTI